MSLCPWTTQQWFDDVGNPLQFGKIYFYQAGTLIPKTTYKKADQSETNEHPIVLDAAGRAKVWLIDGEAYDEVDHDENDNVLRSVQGIIINGGGGAGGGGEPGVETYTVKVSAGDAADGFLQQKLVNSASIVWQKIDVGGVEQLRPVVDVDAVLNYKVKGDTADPVPGYLDAKVENTETVQLSVNPVTHKIRATFVGEIPEDDHLVLGSLADTIPGPLGTKLRPGTGIEMTQTTDGVNGVVTHISVTDDESATAPLHEVMTGDGAGGVLSSPEFTAVGGDVSMKTLKANATGEAITAPNGSMVAAGVAEMTQSAWGGDGFAWFGPKGHNPETNDGTLSGLVAGDFHADVVAPTGGSACLVAGAGSGTFAVYEGLASCSVPISAPAFHQLDAVVLVGASYSSVYHGTICFFGIGTSFVVPPGSSANRSIRLSNSSSVSIAVTGTATAFSLAPGQSRDLIWTADSITPTVDKWY